MPEYRVLVVDDKENMLRLFEKILGPEYEVTTASDGKAALDLLTEKHFDVVVSDVRMPGANGFEVLRAARAANSYTEIVLLTAYASVEDAVEAIKEGAYDYLQKPFEPEHVQRVVGRAAERKHLREQAANLQRNLDDLYSFDSLVGKSPPMRAVYDLLRRAGEMDITVLITGETGTGKELAARAIHHASARRNRRFVAINCGALPPDLVESELFGHAKGAFTGAVGARAGLFEEAAGGTLFLDEVGELPLAVQVKLNRALQEKEVRRVGATRTVAVDVRVVAATHRDLKDEVEAGRFRGDLYYRLNVFPIELPPLRQRRSDIPLLAAHFLERVAREHRRAIRGFDPEALAALTGYGWPGNVRELENAVERAVAVTDGPVIPVTALPAETRTTTVDGASFAVRLDQTFREAVDAARVQVSRDYLVALMKDFGGNVTRATERAGVERESLHRLLRRFNVRPDDFRTD